MFESFAVLRDADDTIVVFRVLAAWPLFLVGPTCTLKTGWGHALQWWRTIYSVCFKACAPRSRPAILVSDPGCSIQAVHPGCPIPGVLSGRPDQYIRSYESDS